MTFDEACKKLSNVCELACEATRREIEADALQGNVERIYTTAVDKMNQADVLYSGKFLELAARIAGGKIVDGQFVPGEVAE